MNSLEFVKKWSASRQSESATAQEHFDDLCRVLNEKTPNEVDPNGDFYAFGIRLREGPTARGLSRSIKLGR